MDNAIKKENENYETTIENSNNSIAIRKVLELESQKISAIEREIEEAYKAFPMAFHAYSEYENFLSSHILLELIREDYALFRESLHKTLTPINQV